VPTPHHEMVVIFSNSCSRVWIYALNSVRQGRCGSIGAAGSMLSSSSASLSSRGKLLIFRFFSLVVFGFPECCSPINAKYRSLNWRKSGSAATRSYATFVTYNLFSECKHFVSKICWPMLLEIIHFLGWVEDCRLSVKVCNDEATSTTYA